MGLPRNPGRSWRQSERTLFSPDGLPLVTCLPSPSTMFEDSPATTMASLPSKNMPAHLHPMATPSEASALSPALHIPLLRWCFLPKLLARVANTLQSSPSGLTVCPHWNVSPVKGRHSVFGLSVRPLHLPWCLVHKTHCSSHSC